MLCVGGIKVITGFWIIYVFWWIMITSHNICSGEKNHRYQSLSTNSSNYEHSRHGIQYTSFDHKKSLMRTNEAKMGNYVDNITASIMPFSIWL